MDLFKKTRKELIEEINKIRDENHPSHFPGIAVINKYEHLLSQSEEQYRMFFDKNPLPMWVFNNKTFRFIAVNAAAISHYGYSGEEFLAMTVREIHTKEDEDIFLESIKKDEKTFDEKNEKSIWKHIKKDNTIIEVEGFISSLVVDGKDNSLVLIKDVTEQRKMERSIRQSEEGYRLLFEKNLAAQKSLEQSREDYRNLIEYSPDGIFIHDERGFVVFANPMALEMIGIKSLMDIGNKSVFEYILPEYHKLIRSKKEKYLQEEASPFYSIRVQRLDKSIIEVELKSIPFVFEGKNATLAVVHDISLQRKLNKELLRAQIAEESNRKLQLEINERKKIENELRVSEKTTIQSLMEKEVLLKEVHHRVKNNLQVISSILSLQSSYTQDLGTLNILKESQNRIKTMAFIHESLYQTKDFSRINFADYIETLAKNIFYSYSIHENNIKLTLDSEDIFLNLDLAISCGLLINELVSNALKYAFPENKNGEIFIGIYLRDNVVKLIVSDDGAGLPVQLDYRNAATLGFQLVITLVEQLSGKIELEKNPKTKFTITFNNKTNK